jgi:hypothetical protein
MLYGYADKNAGAIIPAAPIVAKPAIWRARLHLASVAQQDPRRRYILKWICRIRMLEIVTTSIE